MPHRTDGVSHEDRKPVVSLEYNPLSHATSSWLLYFRLHSRTHRVCWLGPLYILPAIAVLLFWGYGETAAAVMGLIWIAWCFLSAPLIGLAIRWWGERFWFCDFSRNTNPTPLERRIAEIGLLTPVIVGLASIIVMLIVSGTHEILAILGCGIAIAMVLAFFGSFIVPFLIIIFTGFKVRPVIDEGDGEEVVSIVLQGSS